MRALPFLLVLTGCTPTFSPTHTLCDLIVGGAWGSSTEDTFLTQSDLQEAEFRILQAVGMVTDRRMSDPRQVCSKFQGVKVFTHSEAIFKHPWNGIPVYGYANCSGRNVVLGTPADRKWQTSSLAHELMHIAQDCFTPKPVDPSTDDEHANWIRDGIREVVLKVEDTTWNP